MTMLGDRFDELIPKVLNITLATGDESRSKLKLVRSRDLVGSSHDAGRRKKFDAGPAGSNGLAVLVRFVQKVSDFRIALARCHAGLSVRNIESVEQNWRLSEQAEICTAHRPTRSIP